MPSKKSSKQLVGDSLRRARERASLSQTDVAKAIDLSRVQVNQHEHGRGMKEETLEKYAAFYRIPVQSLRYGASPEPLGVAEAVAALDAAWRGLLDSLEREGVLPPPPSKEG